MPSATRMVVTVRRSDQALVLRRTPFRDTSLVLQLLTRKHGRLGVIARGIRRSREADRAALAGFHTLNIHFQGRQREQGLMTLIGAEMLTSRPRMLAASSPLPGSAGQVIQESLYRALWPLDPQPALFDLACTTLNHLENTTRPPEETLARYLAELVQRLGYGWDLSCCVGCGRTQQLDFFSIRRLQSVCRGCPLCRSSFRSG